MPSSTIAHNYCPGYVPSHGIQLNDRTSPTQDRVPVSGPYLSGCRGLNARVMRDLARYLLSILFLSLHSCFLPRDALVHSAVLRLRVVRPSVRLSVCNVGGSGSHRLEILETNCTVNSTNIFALRSPKAIHLIPGEHGEIWGRLGVGWRAGEQKRQYLWNAQR